MTTFAERRMIEAEGPAERAARTLARLNALLAEVVPKNPLYARKLAGIELPLRSLEQFSELPLTTKEELQAPGPDPFQSPNLTYPQQRYVRFHHTSGTRGRPLVVLDTATDWTWWIEAWQYVLDAIGVTTTDRVLMAFSFGPFIGFWSAHDAVLARGCMLIPSGGLSSLARLELIRTSQATVVFATPSYALHLADVAKQKKLPLGDWNVRRLVLAGEPGGSIPAVQKRLFESWQAEVCDHCGASEVGPWGFAARGEAGLTFNEAEFFPEFLPLESGGKVQEGELAELVVTNFGRYGFPAIRYRTGDVVRPLWNRPGPSRFVQFTGGVLGRVDDMLIVRGVNLYPSAIEAILREFPEIEEYRLIATREGERDELTVQIEDLQDRPERVAEALQLRLNLRVEVSCVTPGSLPRFEGKGKRFLDQRPKR